METLVYSWGIVYQTPSGNASGSPAARSAAKRQPDGDGQQEHVADDGGDHAAGGRAAEAAARDVESAHGRLREGDDEHDEHRGDRRRPLQRESAAPTTSDAADSIFGTSAAGK